MNYYKTVIHIHCVFCVVPLKLLQIIKMAYQWNMHVRVVQSNGIFTHDDDFKLQKGASKS